MRLLALLALLSSCAAAPARTHTPRPVTLDFDKAGDEVVQVLADYLRVDTINPPGNETRGAVFMRDLLAREGIESQVHEFAPGRGTLIARLKAKGTPKQKPLCLLSHLDVVTANDADWPADAQPLSGAIKDGFLWGRGALDMKGMGALELMTLINLKRLDVPLGRDVILLAVADEEVHNGGMRLLVDEHWNELDCGVLINEGGMGLQGLLFEGQTVFPITVAEKGVLWLRLVAEGEAGHGSTPVPGRAPARLLAAIEKLNARKTPTKIHASVYELLARAGAQKGGLTGSILQSPALVDVFVTGKLMAKPPTRAAMTNTCQVTGFEGKGSAPNVIPNETAAIVDCRVRPDTTPEALLAELKTLVEEEHVRLEVIQKSPASESSWEDPFFDALVFHLTDGRTDAVAGPAISPGFTDSNLARPKGTKAYGMVPFEVNAELLGTMHGKNERVPVEQVKQGFRRLFRSVVDAAAAP